MRKTLLAALISVFTTLIFSPALVAQHQETASSAASTSILGFTAARAAAEHKIEAEFQAIPSPERAREWHRTFTAEPHPAASERNNQLADFIADEWRKEGWEDVTLRRYDVLHSRPRSYSLEVGCHAQYMTNVREYPVG